MLKGALCPENQNLFAYLLVLKHTNIVTGEVVGLSGVLEVCVLGQDLSLLACMYVNLASVGLQGATSGFGVRG